MSTYTVATSTRGGHRSIWLIEAASHEAARKIALLRQVRARPNEIPGAALALIPKETP